jgi:hypothetical protein
MATKQGTIALGAAITLVALLLAGCGSTDTPAAREATTGRSVPATPAPSAPVGTTASPPVATTSASSPSPSPVLAANQQPPLATLRRYVDALNKGDIDEALATFAVSARLQDLLCRPAQECVGHAAIRPVLEARVVSHRCITVRRAEESGHVVTAQVEVRADEIRRVGVEYIVLTYTAQVARDEIVTLSVQADLGDTNTSHYSAIGVGLAQAGTPLPAPPMPCG